MRAKFEKFFAFVVTALMVFEMVPALAWAEAGESMGQAADAALAELLDEQGKDSDTSADPQPPANESDDGAANGENASDEASGDPAEAVDGPTAMSDEPAEDGIAQIDAPAQNSSVAGRVTEGFEDLFTLVPEDMTVEVANGPFDNWDKSKYGNAGFSKTDMIYNNHAVWQSDAVSSHK